ncbi:peptidase dimerization domain-containing protein [uncultured Oscillibacter sp.]|jgi:tripeptide aminopeptidase|uniref:peptidase dimerization domain-containing protein n=1 Tax=uncultured Oscillibacter sp. TaxID=876091 RepID=UPI00261A33C4|nr:peptidase dimerization domain-containing protein [uncultured Oscillibacter sp.]
MYFLGADLIGLPAHAGNEPEKGIDAAKIMCDMLSSLRQGRLDELTTANFPILSTSSRTRNVVCDHASFRGEARSREFRCLEEYVSYFKDHCLRMAAEKGAKICVEIEEVFRPFHIGEEQEVLRLARRACGAVGLECLVEPGGGGMDANVFNAKGISSVGVATGYYKNHTKEEYLVLEDFYRAGELAAAMIQLYGEAD